MLKSTNFRVILSRFEDQLPYPVCDFESLNFLWFFNNVLFKNSEIRCIPHISWYLTHFCDCLFLYVHSFSWVFSTFQPVPILNWTFYDSVPHLMGCFIFHRIKNCRGFIQFIKVSRAKMFYDNFLNLGSNTSVYHSCCLLPTEQAINIT